MKTLLLISALTLATAASAQSGAGVGVGAGTGMGAGTGAGTMAAPSSTTNSSGAITKPMGSDSKATQQRMEDSTLGSKSGVNSRMNTGSTKSPTSGTGSSTDY